MDDKGTDLVSDTIYDEFKQAKKHFFMSTTDVMPSFITMWSFEDEMKRARKGMPKWNTVLKAAMTNAKSAQKNKQHNPALVHTSLPLLLLLLICCSGM